MKVIYTSTLKFTFLLLLFFALIFRSSTTCAQGTAFTYQGRLNANGGPANGTYDFQFQLATDPSGINHVGNPYSTNGIVVTNGLFLATMDFGPGILTGSNYWLVVYVRTNNGGVYTSLTPPQPLTPAPYAIFANSSSNLLGVLPTSQLSGTIPNGNLPASPTFSTVTATSFAGNGVNVSNVNALTLNGLTSSNFWQTGGNNVGGGQFLGSTNNQPVEIWVNGARVLRLEPGIATVGAPNVIAGASVNYVAGGVVGATISGGGTTDYQGSSFTNWVLADFGVIGGGADNAVLAASFYSTVGGGADNVAGGTNLPGFTVASTVAGGAGNSALAAYASTGGGALNTNSAFAATIGGGLQNLILPDVNLSEYATIAGGWNNRNFALQGTIGGGRGNLLSSNAIGATISGGAFNTILADNSTSAYNVSAIGGGLENTNGGFYSTIGGGFKNYIQFGADEGTIAGGDQNTIQSNADFSTINGGFRNSVLTNSVYATVAGGFNNVAGGKFSFAAGQQAQATNNGTFVWADSQGSVFASTNNDSFNVRAQGGVSFVTSGTGVNVDGFPALVSGGSSGITIQQNASGAPNVIEGSQYNFVANGVLGGTVSGGGSTSALATNSVTANYGTVSGGFNNTASAVDATVSGGGANSARGLASVVAGGSSNTASNSYATVGGGFGNTAGAVYATVAGGSGNTATNSYATVGGGLGNNNNGPASVVAGGDSGFIGSAADHATIGGGYHNQITSYESTIAGGYFNLINAQDSAIAGGDLNVINSSANQSFIGGGINNTNNSTLGMIGGGRSNVIGTNSSYSTIGGGTYNLISSNALSSFIGGGSNNIVRGPTATLGGGLGNSADAAFTTVGGGVNDHATNFAATVAGGENNIASGYDSTVGGGGANVASGNNSAVAGGEGNVASGFASVVGGGGYNEFAIPGNVASGDSSTVAGGSGNQATNMYASVPGGYGNIAGGLYSFAAGQQAQALHQGAFVWADSQNATFSSTANDQFLIRARGGVGIDSAILEGSLTLGTNTYLKDHAIYLRGNSGSDHNHGLAYNGQTTTNFGTGQFQVDGPVLWGFSGGVLGTRNGGDHAALQWSNTSVTVNGTFNNNSDRNAKQDFASVTPAEILNKVAQLPLSEWSYKVDSSTRHIGPMAQDFYSAFNVGTDEKHIAPIDEGGVALAAIQGLNQEVGELKSENAELKQRLATLEKLIRDRKNN